MKGTSITQQTKSGNGPSYHIHTETRNISFIQTAKDLRDLGVENNLFFLALYDISLIHVDPHDPNLTQAQQLSIIHECLRNPFYFIRECIRIGEDGGTGTPYLLNRGNLAALFCFLNHLDHYLTLPRQKGKTQSTIAAILWAYLFGTTNTEMMFINKQEADANNNLARLKQQRDLLPPFMRMTKMVLSDGKTDKGRDNVKSLLNPVNKNKIVTKPSASSVEKAEGLGRGCTQTIQYYDETEFTEHIKTIVEAAGPAFNTASKNAKKNNAAYCRIMTSTPGDLDSSAGQEAMEIVNKCAKWTEKFYDWTQDEINEYIAMNSENDIIYIEYSYKQLGEDEEWFLSACKKVLNNPIKIRREILLQRLHGSNSSPFELEDVQAVQELRKDPIDELYINKTCRVDIYKKLDPKKTYIVGVDCSAGIGEDAHALTIIDPYTLHPVAEFRAAYMSTTNLARFIHILIQKHIPRSILCIERNFTGIAVIDILMETSTRSRVYFENTTKLNIDQRYDDKGFLESGSSNRRLLGVYTGRESRSLMMNLLETMVYEDKKAFVTHNITKDFAGLIKTRTGKIEHAKGGHDDSLMSYLIGLYAVHFGKNLSLFGFTKGRPPEEELNQGLAIEDQYKQANENIDNILNMMSDEEQAYFGQSGAMAQSSDMYTQAMHAEMQQARYRANEVNRQLGVKNADYNVEHDQFGVEKTPAIPMSFFDELNSY